MQQSRFLSGAKAIALLGPALLLVGCHHRAQPAAAPTAPVALTLGSDTERPSPSDLSPKEIISPAGITFTCGATPSVAFPGELITVSGSAKISNPKLVPTYRWTTAGSGGTITGDSNVAEIDTKNAQPGSYVAKGHVEGGKQPKQTGDCTAAYTIQRFEPPNVTCSANPSMVSPGDSSVISVIGVSPQNRPLNYSYSSTAGSVNSTDRIATLSTTGAAPGPITITCSAADDSGLIGSATATVTVAAPPAAPAPQASSMCSVGFNPGKRRSARVNYRARSCLDDIALSLQRASDARLALTGQTSSGERNESKLAAERALNTKDYLVREKGIDASRISIFVGKGDKNAVSTTVIPAGSSLEEDGQQPIDESSVRAQARISSHRHLAVAGAEPASDTTPLVSRMNGCIKLRVFYATDRKPLSALRRGSAYGPDESSPATMSYGSILVSLPPGHTPGVIEEPSIFKLEFSENAQKHVTIDSVTQESERSFYTNLHSAVENAEKREVLLFIHGYNVSFDAAAKRLAQISYDMAFHGAPVLYSWPSRDSLAGYTADEDSVQWTTAHLVDFLQSVYNRSGATTVHVIAHSMGNRALLAALEVLGRERSNVRLGHIVLAAPDVSKSLFVQQIPILQSLASHITLYASSKDQALAASWRVNHYARAGQSGRNLTIIPPVETIDASGVVHGFLGHSYFGENTLVMNDIADLIQKSLPAEKRPNLRPSTLGTAVYWTFTAPAR